MKIEVKGYVLEFVWMSGKLNSQFTPGRGYYEGIFTVWLKFEDSKDLSTIEFGVAIPAKEYTEEEFKQTVYFEALEAIDRLEKEQAESRVRRAEVDRRKKDLDGLVQRTAQTLGIDWLRVGS